jgi:Protein of unknown function (DUF3293)
MTGGERGEGDGWDVPAPPAALRQSYVAAEYWVEAPGRPFCLHVGQPSAECNAFLESFGAQRFAVVTAWNPLSQPLHASVNAARHAELEALVRVAGICFVPTANVDPGGTWPAEPGLGLLDPPPGLVDSLLTRFHQYAAVVIARDGTATLQWHAAVR